MTVFLGKNNGFVNSYKEFCRSRPWEFPDESANHCVEVMMLFSSIGKRLQKQNKQHGGRVFGDFLENSTLNLLLNGVHRNFVGRRKQDIVKF